MVKRHQQPISASVLPAHKYIYSVGTSGSEEKPLYILVDAFSYVNKLPESFYEKNNVLFFLTHAHSDHYTGLRDSWSAGKVYCSNVTGDLLRVLVDVPEEYIHRLPMNQEIDVAFGVRVTLVTANHCPGAVIFLFDLPNGKRVVHVGDFRYERSVFRDGACSYLERFTCCDALYLDTTYCNPRHKFPPQKESIEYIASTIKDLLRQGGKLLFLISTYVIGKEKVLEEIYRQTGQRIYLTDKKMRVAEHLGLDDVSMFTTDPEATPIHVVKWNFLGETWPYFRPNYVDPARYSDGVYTHVHGFVPTGFVYQKAEDTIARTMSKNNVTIHLVPYSEHSSYDELIEFVTWVRPKRVIPTVNASDEKQVAKQLKHFSSLVDVTANKASFIAQLGNGKGMNTITCTITNDEDASNTMTKKNNKEKEEEEVVVVTEGGVSEIVDLVADEDDDTRETDHSIRLLREFCGDDITLREAKKLLHEHKGDVSLAASSYFENGHARDTKRQKTHASTPAKGSGKKKGVSQTSITKFLKKTPEKKREESISVPCSQQESPKASVQASMSIASKTAEMNQQQQPPATNIDRGTRIVDAPIDAITKSLESYDPIEDSIWPTPHATPYLHIARTFEAMDSTTKRLKISDILTNAFRSILAISPKDLVSACYLFLGRLAPDYHNIELNIGGSSVSNAMTEALGISKGKIREMHKTYGDLGDIASVCKKSQQTLRRPEPLTVQHVYDTMMRIATDSGTGTAARKKAWIVQMLQSSTGPETKYLVRTLVRNLRVGANWRSVLPAVAKSIVCHKLEKVPDKQILDEAAATCSSMFHVVPNIAHLIDIMLKYEQASWSSQCRLTPSIPIKPMLAKISEGVSDAVEQIGQDQQVLVEFKYDGMRAQIHIKKGGFEDDPQTSVKIFSRNCEDRTPSFMDVVPNIMSAMGPDTQEAIFDCEIVAVAPQEDGSFAIRAFQDLSTRPKTDVEESRAPIVQVCVYAFDCIQVHGESLLSNLLSDRRKHLCKALPNLERGKVELAHSTTFEPAILNTESLQSCLMDALDQRAEGLMLKAMDSPYEPNKRSNKWIKLKKDYCSDLHDTIDLVPIAAWHGNGRKKQWYSPFLMAVWDETTQQFQSLCRVMSGFSDEFYKEATERLSKNLLPSKPYDVMTGEKPSVWFGQPYEVWELRGAELSISPVHCAGIGQVHEEKGLGLRFPRFIRIREDKNPEDATPSDLIVHTYLKQNRR
ncbi:DNA ligase 6 [Picochlorum sp. SENEW3]|nr:DNA ligase 6 [Picochlorum sp. SENEW3]